jgi:DNA-binding MarR family transcriptional regulator
VSINPPPAIGHPRDDDLALGMLLATAHHNARRALQEGLRPLGIEARHITVLTALAQQEAISQRQLGRRLGLDKSTVVRILDELERLGLASRLRTEHDRRAYTIQLTPQGRERVHEADKIAAAVGHDLFGRLDPAEREQLVASLTKIAEQTST